MLLLYKYLIFSSKIPAGRPKKFGTAEKISNQDSTDAQTRCISLPRSLQQHPWHLQKGKNGDYIIWKTTSRVLKKMAKNQINSSWNWIPDCADFWLRQQLVTQIWCTCRYVVVNHGCKTIPRHWFFLVLSYYGRIAAIIRRTLTEFFIGTVS